MPQQAPGLQVRLMLIVAQKLPVEDLNTAPSNAGVPEVSSWPRRHARRAAMHRSAKPLLQKPVGSAHTVKSQICRP